MKFTFKQALVLTVFVAGIAVNAHAQTSPPMGAAPPAPATTAMPKNHPCMSEHQSVKSACASDPCSAACKAAHQQMKACRAANHLPPPVSKGGGNKHPCAKSSATTPAPGATVPEGAAPASP